jgi:hypothetical protein
MIKRKAEVLLLSQEASIWLRRAQGCDTRDLPLLSGCIEQKTLGFQLVALASWVRRRTAFAKKGKLMKLQWLDLLNKEKTKIALGKAETLASPACF